MRQIDVWHEMNEWLKIPVDPKKRVYLDALHAKKKGRNRLQRTCQSVPHQHCSGQSKGAERTRNIKISFVFPYLRRNMVIKS